MHVTLLFQEDNKTIDILKACCVDHHFIVFLIASAADADVGDMQPTGKEQLAMDSHPCKFKQKCLVPGSGCNACFNKLILPVMYIQYL
jgi:hypothetical protein